MRKNEIRLAKPAGDEIAHHLRGAQPPLAIEGDAGDVVAQADIHQHRRQPHRQAEVDLLLSQRLDRLAERFSDQAFDPIEIVPFHAIEKRMGRHPHELMGIDLVEPASGRARIGPAAMQIVARPEGVVERDRLVRQRIVAAATRRDAQFGIHQLLDVEAKSEQVEAVVQVLHLAQAGMTPAEQR